MNQKASTAGQKLMIGMGMSKNQTKKTGEGNERRQRKEATHDQTETNRQKHELAEEHKCQTRYRAVARPSLSLFVVFFFFCFPYRVRV